MIISTILVDDDPDSRLIIRTKLENHFPDIHIAGEAATVSEGVRLIASESPSLLLLDISLPDGNGFDILSRLPDHRFETVFITAFNQFAIEAFRFSASDYLLKPIEDKLLREAVERVRERIRHREASFHWKELQHNMLQADAYKRRLAVAVGNGYQFVELNAVVRVESSSNYSHIYLTDGSRLTAAQTLGHFESVFPSAHFCRIHHSHIVNLHYVERFEREGAGGLVILKGGTALAVSQRKKEALLKRMVK